jgi:hypothetical protein
MSETDGMAIPLPDGEGVVAGRRRAYAARLFADKWAQLIGLLSGLTVGSILDWSVRLLSGFMIVIPIYIFSDYLHQGVLFVSPPLFFMFLAGITGLVLPRRGQAQEESLSQSGGRQ